jgi:hypothetical protein
LPSRLQQAQRIVILPWDIAKGHKQTWHLGGSNR